MRLYVLDAQNVLLDVVPLAMVLLSYKLDMTDASTVIAVILPAIVHQKHLNEFHQLKHTL